MQVVEDFKDRLQSFGYVEGEFAYPQMTPQEEKQSMVKHLEIFGNADKSCVAPPTEKESKRCIALVSQMLQCNSYVPDEDYNQISGVMNVINSS